MTFGETLYKLSMQCGACYILKELVLEKYHSTHFFSLFLSFLTKKCVTACSSPSHVDDIRMA